MTMGLCWKVLIQKLRQALECKSNLFWQVKFLERYIKENMNPRGLRVQVFPNLWEIKHDFKKSSGLHKKDDEPSN